MAVAESFSKYCIVSSKYQCGATKCCLLPFHITSWSAMFVLISKIEAARLMLSDNVLISLNVCIHIFNQWERTIGRAEILRILFTQYSLTDRNSEIIQRVLVFKAVYVQQDIS